jgi:hypothetical protein
VDAFTPESWHDLFVASAGACAALTGLLFVAVSVNLGPILKYAGLPERALQTLLLLLGALVVSIAGLIPGQSTEALGVELLVLAAFIIGGILSLLPATLGSAREHERAVAHVALLLPGTLPLAVGGASMLAGGGGGLYWIVAGIVGAVLGASINAWVLLVEINR